MRKFISIVLCFFIFTGCAAQGTIESRTPSTVPPETTAAVLETLPPEIPLEIFVPDENAESFRIVSTNVYELDPLLITALLIEHSILHSDVTLISAELVDTQLTLDFNQAFADQLKTYGTSGERMMIGCVVNTFLRAYDAQTVYITIDGGILESGHVIYDFPIGFME